MEVLELGLSLVVSDQRARLLLVNVESSLDDVPLIIVSLYQIWSPDALVAVAGLWKERRHVELALLDVGQVVSASAIQTNTPRQHLRRQNVQWQDDVQHFVDFLKLVQVFRLLDRSWVSVLRIKGEGIC